MGEKRKENKNLENRGVFIFYIRKNHKQLWIDFLNFIEQDENIKKMRTKNKAGLASIAIMMLINKYVHEKKRLQQTENANN